MQLTSNYCNEIIKVKVEKRSLIAIRTRNKFSSASNLILDYDLNPSYKNQLIKKAREAR